MDAGNQTQIREFVFMGYPSHPSHQITLFLVFLAAYLITMITNLTILILVVRDSRLHSPMYFFLSHLSCLDICLSSTVVPKILVNVVRQRQTISYNGCLAQVFFLVSFAATEPALLAIMAYDRYAAICRPLHYTHLMSNRVCVMLASGFWLWGFLNSSVYTALASKLSFCGVNLVPHIYCDVPPLMKIACGHAHADDLVNHITSTFVGPVPFVFIILSYLYILASILRLRSNLDRQRAFSTCGSHITVVTLYIGNGFLNYNQPRAGYSLATDTLVSSMFCIVTPMLNPLIYSLRNQEVREALRKVLHRQRTG
ncbi:olfactory receptor 5B21-like [Pogona vitticeps]